MIFNYYNIARLAEPRSLGDSNKKYYIISPLGVDYSESPLVL